VEELDFTFGFGELFGEELVFVVECLCGFADTVGYTGGGFFMDFVYLELKFTNIL